MNWLMQCGLDGAAADLAVNVSRRQALCLQIVEHNVYFKRVTIEYVVDFAALDEITYISQSVEMLRWYRSSQTSARYANPAE